MSSASDWIALSLVPDVGPVMAKKLLAAFGSPENIFAAGLSDLHAVKGLTKERAANIKDFRFQDTVEIYLKAAEKKGMRVVGYHDPLYPDVLRETEGTPVVLYMKGEYIPSDRYGIAVVGSRDNTTYGEQVTGKIAHDLAASGFTIISGMARGIDTLSHAAALAAGGRTIAVLGSGLDVCYPSENRGLMERITRSGCGLSEFPPGTMPHRENFPRRNRIISGLSMGVLVVEAAVDSGSLITAQYALEQNREVFAVPGNITSRNSSGTNRLIRQGARVVAEARDIIEELAPVLKGFISVSNTAPRMEMSDEESNICSALSREPKHIDVLSREMMLPVHRALGLLLSLEIKGVVRQSGGKRFYLA